MAITTINQENFDDQVTRSSAPVLLDFWAAWCGPCSMLSPVVEELGGRASGKFPLEKST